jgi:hypothetical protein
MEKMFASAAIAINGTSHGMKDKRNYFLLLRDAGPLLSLLLLSLLLLDLLLLLDPLYLLLIELL